MASSLVLGQSPYQSTWFEDFVYSPTPNTDTFAVLPPELEFGGQVLTSDGWVTLSGSAGYDIRDGQAGNDDINYPYGGVAGAIRAYLLFPRIAWDQVTGTIFTVNASQAAQFSCAMSFTGHTGDKIYLCVFANGAWSVREVLTGSYGFTWNTRTYNLPVGTSKVAIVFRAAPFTQSSGGVAPPGTLGHQSLYYPRRLRVSNFQVTYVTAVPSAPTVRTSLITNTLLTAVASIERLVAVSLLTDSALVVATVVTPHLDLLSDSTLTVASIEAGAELAPVSLLEDTRLDLVTEITALSASATGGFQIGSRMNFWITPTILPDVASLVRPLSTYTITMTKPGIVHGRPMTPRSRSITEVTTSVSGAGAVLGRISPYSTQHVYPTVAGDPPRYRWLSLDAIRDQVTGECTTWGEQGGGPAWSTPGDYRPVVGDFLMQTDAGHQPINYPAVSFDGSHLDHLNIELAADDWTDGGASLGRGVTWFLVGSFTRFRGMLRDSCPIIDFTADAVIDYTGPEMIADRANLPPWFDVGGSSMYTGWHAVSDTNPNLSGITWQSQQIPSSSVRIPYVDNTPVVLAICLNGLNSYIRMTPIYGTGPSSLVAMASTPREIFTSGNPLPRTVTLGKSRNRPPFGGLFGTGSMSLLEVAFYKRALDPSETDTISRYLAGVYAPASVREEKSQIVTGRVGPPVQDSPIMFTTVNASDPTYLLHGGVVSSVEDVDVVPLNNTGVPMVYVHPSDYAEFLIAFHRNTP